MKIEIQDLLFTIFMSIPAYIELTQSPLKSLQEILRESEHSSIAILVDEHTEASCYPLFADLPDHVLIQIHSGEQHKTITTCEHIWSKLTSARFDRKSVLINIGGGVIGDMGGFAAACFKRGIDFINIPTTLLAQVDASIGGKLGIDFEGLKNHIGVFRMPLKVIISPIFLNSLDQRQINSGFAEVIKHGLIYDIEYFKSLKSPESYGQDQFLSLISESIKIKNQVVEKDPQEHGLRKILNFGHTIGHAIESLFLESNHTLFHGEAIAVGMICETFLSKKKLGLKKDQLNEIIEFITGIYPKIDLNNLDKTQFLDKLEQDKKNKGIDIQAALLSEIGSAKYEVSISKEDAIESLDFYSSVFSN